MSAPNRYSLRIVVQHVYADHRSRYRVVAYGDSRTYRLLEFESLDRLQEALHSVVPDFDERALSIRKDLHDTYIAFTGDMELDDSQLSVLGLKDDTKS